MSAYTFFGYVGYYVMLFSTIFYYKDKSNAMGLYTRAISSYASRINETLGKIIKVAFIIIEGLLAATLVDITIGLFNRSFGDFVGTGANYFGFLLTILFFWILFSVLIVANTLKILDISTMYLPLHLVFVKLSCFCNGCCHGIEWEHGIYNSNPYYEGTQVPVQLIEAFWALLIFFILLWYRKRAKPGNVFPMYMILYSATRFFSEFFRPEENVLGPLKMYHILCLIGIAYGFLHLAFLHFYRDIAIEFFDNINAKLDMKIEEMKTAKIAAEKERTEAERLERLEKAKAARAKAKKRKK